MTRNYFNCCIEPRRPQLDAPPREPDVRESVEDYLARGGRIERLPGAGEGL